MRTPVLRCPFSRGRAGVSGAGLLLVLALSACGSPAVAPAPAAPGVTASASATPKMGPKMGAARSAPARHVRHASSGRASAPKSAARAAASAGTSASKTTRRARVTARADTSVSTRQSVPTTADLQAALLTPADMPAGYNVQPTDTALLGDSSLSGCPQLTGSPPDVTAQALVDLAGPARAPSVSETLMQVSPGHAVTAMAGYAAMAADCSQFTGVVGHYQVSFTTSPLAVSALGDQRSAVQITGLIAAAHASIYVDFVAIRHDSTLIVVIGAGLTSSPAFTEQAASTAYARVAARW
jgi:hypothetical protein